MAVNPYAHGKSTPMTPKKKKNKNPYAHGGSTPVTTVTSKPPVEEVVLGAMAGPGDIGGDRESPPVVDTTNMADMYASKNLVSGAKGTKPPVGFGHPGGGSSPTTGGSASASIGGDNMAKAYEAINISPGTNLQPDDPTDMGAAYEAINISPGTNLQPDEPGDMAGAYEKLDIAPGDNLQKQQKPLSMEEEYRIRGLMGVPTDSTDMGAAYQNLGIAAGDDLRPPLSMEEEMARRNLNPGERLGGNVLGGTGYDEDIIQKMREAMGSSPEPPETLDDLTGDVTQVLSDRLGMDGRNPAIDRDIMDFQRQAERDEAQLMEDLNRMGVLRSGDTAEALGDFRGAVSRGIADLEARGYDQQSQAIQDLLQWQRGEREKTLTEEEIASSQLGREVTEAGQTGQFRDEDTMAERALSDDLQTSAQARNLAQSANQRAENLSQQQILDAVLGREVLTDENLRADTMMQDDLKTTDLNRRISESQTTGRFDPDRYGEGITDTLEKKRLDDDLLNRAMERDIQEAGQTGMYKESPTIERENQLISQILEVATPEVMEWNKRGDLAEYLAGSLSPELREIFSGLGDTPPPPPGGNGVTSFKGTDEALRNLPGGVAEDLGEGRWLSGDGSVYFLREENGELKWELEG